MADERQPTLKKGRLVVEPGKPLSFVEAGTSETPVAPPGSLTRALLDTLTAYRKAARDLLEAKYASQKDNAPAHLRDPGDIFILSCSDGVFVRYDSPGTDEPKARFAEVNQRISEVAPLFSEQVIHFPDDPASYALPPGGPEIILAKTDPSGATEELGRLRPVIYGTMRLPDGFVVLPPPARPPPIISIQNEFDIQLQGVVVPADRPELRSGPNVDQFLAHSRFRFPVGWKAIEIYPPIGIEHWKAEYAPIWAEMDLLAAIAQRNILVRLCQIRS